MVSAGLCYFQQNYIGISILDVRSISKAAYISFLRLDCVAWIECQLKLEDYGDYWTCASMLQILYCALFYSYKLGYIIAIILRSI